MVSGHPKSIGIFRVDGLSTGPLDLGRHSMKIMRRVTMNNYIMLKSPRKIAH